MSAQVQYEQARGLPLDAGGRRIPFANTGNQLPTARGTGATTPTKPNQVQKKAAGSPPLPRQNTKTAPPSPPQVIRDTTHAVSYSRVGFLGEGGFARVYEVQDRSGARQAIKVVTKDSLKTKKAKTKLYAEIKIHRSLQHPNIVRFGECFEDRENVYMTLELCESGSLMDMLRRRKRFTEPESRFFSVQLIGACHYMHTNQVIHRDLKLGNLFLDQYMNVKVGDFGLAALIENPGERKKTICGTPNYIAPEVLFDTANGHSFEVDTWSIGVILYTLVVGKPPFQTKEVKTIYKRIRDNEYDFPEDKPVSAEVQDLIQQILTHDPKQRPTLHDIVDHHWYTGGIVPSHVPRTAQDRAPDFRHITPTMSKENYIHLRRYTRLDEDHQPINVPKSASNLTGKMPNSSAAANASTLNSSVALAQQEREFQKAVQPGSPISALLGAARQPLVMGPGNITGGREREQPLIRKLQAAGKEARSPARPIVERTTSSLGKSVIGPGIGSVNTRNANLQDIEEEDLPESDDNDVFRRKELEAQKARIVAQMTSEPPNAAAMRRAAESDDVENIPPNARSTHSDRAKKHVVSESKPAVPLSSGMHGLDGSLSNLMLAFNAKAKGKLFRKPKDDVDIPEAKVFIVSWVDYCNKYGMGYALTDGSVGVHFNDSTSMVLSPDKDHVDYIISKQGGAIQSVKNFRIEEHPEDLKSKIYLLKHFERYILDRLYGDYPFTYEDVYRVTDLDFVHKYLRMKHVILFSLSNGNLQFNFADHTKVILSSNALGVTYINKDYELTQWTLSELMANSLKPSNDPVENKMTSRLVDKVKYCKEVLLSIKNANNGDEPSSPTSS